MTHTFTPAVANASVGKSQPLLSQSAGFGDRGELDVPFMDERTEHLPAMWVLHDLDLLFLLHAGESGSLNGQAG